jgi:pyrophosphatase PpaX
MHAPKFRRSEEKHMTIKACLFDLDGTLVDSMGLIVASFRETALHFLGKTPPDSELIAGIGTPLKEQLSTFTSDPIERDAMRDFYAEYYIKNHNDHVKSFEGVDLGLRRLKESGQMLGIVTSKNDIGAMRALKHCNLESYFDTIITIDSTTVHKPNPEPVLKALEDVGVSASEAVFVGDSTHDLEAGRAARCFTAAVEWTVFAKSDLKACNPSIWLQTTAEIADLPHRF